MKASLLILGLTIFGSTSVYAQAVRKCTDEVLTCRLDKELITGGKVFLRETSEKFDGFNYDEPSIEADQCVVKLDMAEGDISFNVTIGDSNYMTSIYAVNKSNYGKMLPGDVSFPNVKGQKFYYRYDKTILSCSLN